jgi:hypothetical protein
MRDDMMVRTAGAYLELAKVRHLIELTSNDQVSVEENSRSDPRTHRDKTRTFPLRLASGAPL